MQYILVILYMILFGCNNSPNEIKYIDGTICVCDSIHREYPALPDTMAVYEYPYINGVKHGVAKAYGNTRELYLEQYMVGGVFHGVGITYHDGKVEYIKNYVHGDEMAVILFYPSGSIHSIYPQTNNQFNGDVITLNINGKVESCHTWIADKPHGRCK